MAEVDVAKEAFASFIRSSPSPARVIEWLNENQFNGSPAVLGMLQRSVRTLAEQLNGKDTHFILEIIQNFEDNQYGNASPTMCFVLENNLLYIACNEVGMQPTDVYALCNIGDSTKKDEKNAHNYIGEKGIGFKSIFKVATTVEIISCADISVEEQIWKFDLTEKLRRGLGYIVPEFLPSIPGHVAAFLQGVCKNSGRKGVGGTCLVVHLKPDKVDLIRKQIQQLNPETIMFLQKIKRVFISAGVQPHRIRATKVPITLSTEFKNPPPVAFYCELTHTHTQLKESYLVFQDIYDVTTASRKDRGGVKERAISIAIPINAQNNFKGKIFAYLPTEQETALPFHVNSDFILTASRDELQMDAQWNVVLFSHLVHHIALAAHYLPLLSNLPNLPDSLTFVDPLQLVPTQKPPTPFFTDLHKKLLVRLNQIAIVPVLPHTERRTGSSCVTIPIMLWDILNRNIVPNQPNWKYIVALDKVESFRTQLTSLGVSDANKGVLESVISSQLDTQPDNWFGKLYVFMATSGLWDPAYNSREPVSKLAVVLLSSGERVRFGSTAFLPQTTLSLAPLQQWITGANLVMREALPTDPPASHKVTQWFTAHKIGPLDEKAIVQLITNHLKKSTSHHEVLEATEALMRHKLDPWITKHSLPFVNSNGEIIYPPFSLPIVPADVRHLHLFKKSDRSHFHILDAAYTSNGTLKSTAAALFAYQSLPPLPPMQFSWMTQPASSWGSKPVDLLSLLGEMTTLSRYGRLPGIPPRIKDFLDTECWLPTTTGLLIPRQAYMPTQELCNTFGETVSYVKKEIYNNDAQREGLRYTSVQNAATIRAVTDQLLYFKQAGLHDMHAILPLLNFLLQQHDFPTDPIIPFCSDLEKIVPVISIGPLKNLALSTLDMSKIKPLLTQRGGKDKVRTKYTWEECVKAWKDLANEDAPEPEVVEQVMMLVYHKLDAQNNLEPILHLPVWCGSHYKFQPRESVLYGDRKELVAAFEPDQLKLLWLPTNDPELNFSPSKLKIRYLSTAIVDRVQFAPAPFHDTQLFGPLVRKAVCCWHAKHSPPDWKTGVPENILKLLSTTVEEINVSAMEVVKCAHVEGDDVRSSLKEARKVFLDMRSKPPILYRSVHETDLVKREFASTLGKILVIKGEPLTSFSYFVEEAIMAQQYPKRAVELRIQLETSYPTLPICSNPTSNAYVEPVSQKERDSLVVTASPNTLTSLPPDEATHHQEIAKVSELAELLGAATSGHLALGDMISMVQMWAKSAGSLLAQTAAQELAASNRELDQQTYEDEPPTNTTARSPLNQGSTTSPGSRGPAAPPSMRSPPMSPYTPPSAANSNNQKLVRRNGNRAGRRRVVTDRPNQSDVREKALARFHGRCIVTGVDIPDLLEAAHIVPWRHGGEDVDNDENVILLRVDIHRLLDADPPLVYFTRSETPGHVRVYFTGGMEAISSYTTLNGTDIPLDPQTLEQLVRFGPQPPSLE